MGPTTECEARPKPRPVALGFSGTFEIEIKSDTGGGKDGQRDPNHLWRR